MVPTAKEILLSSTFPGPNYHFPGQRIQDLNQDICEKENYIYSMCDRLLTFLWYILLLIPSICLLGPLLFKVTRAIKTIYRNFVLLQMNFSSIRILFMDFLS